MLPNNLLYCRLDINTQRLNYSASSILCSDPLSTSSFISFCTSSAAVAFADFFLLFSALFAAFPPCFSALAPASAFALFEPPLEPFDLLPVWGMGINNNVFQYICVKNGYNRQQQCVQHTFVLCGFRPFRFGAFTSSFRAF